MSTVTPVIYPLSPPKHLKEQQLCPRQPPIGSAESASVITSKWPEVVMATYKQIEAYGRRMYEVVFQPCWIAHVKELTGLPVKTRHKGQRRKPCPDRWRTAIEATFRHFRMLP